MKIMLDAGHGYSTKGKRSPDGLQEYEFNRAVANFARDLLQEFENVAVYFAHSDQRDVPLQERTDKANSLKVDCYVAIHANAYGNTWNDAGGIETYVHISKPLEATKLAEKIQQNLANSTGLRDRGVKTADFHVLRETKMTSVLVECGFMTNREEVKLLRSDNYRRTCAEAIVKAIADHYKLKKKIVQPPPAAKGIYKIQVGAFKELKNAEELAERLRKDGYNPFIYFEK
ncbi:N-acetylmuramoyl-L-alanine amidase [Bacillus methanolicus]|uniref:N-acetylmuramoyl-L-alanine amidase n=1 Tax=Bacillus methanolicus TaxID=1471 RepID=UPI0023800256|nr:N-acetylmuramoyl-L-alanine amidase [Bacillus methanolicus]MDE3840108.1 N-acetylmuramoyl-L-alanine amidase [Bacillus methanolicus]